MLERSGRGAAMLSTVGVLSASWAFGGGALTQSASAASAPAASRPPHITRQTSSTPSTQRFVVTFDTKQAARSPKTLFERSVRAFGASLAGTHTTGTGSVVVQLNKPLGQTKAASLISALDREAGVAGVQADQIVHTTSIPNDPDYGQQWQLSDDTNGMNYAAARDISAGSGVTVGVVDTGITSHPDLDGSVASGYDFITDPALSRDGDGRDANPQDQGDFGDASCPTGQGNSDWHGTHVAGIIAAQTDNGVGIAGVAGNAKIEPLRALGACGGGYLSDVTDAMLWGAGESVPGLPDNPNPVQVINLSLAGSGSCPAQYQSAIDRVRARGVSVVVAAGNGSADASTNAPANCNGVIAVGAADRNGAKASYSNFGSTVALMAPGDNVLSTVNQGSTTPGEPGYGVLSGTSMAAPHVTGTIALMKAQNPSMTPDEIAAKLKNSARPMTQPCDQGCGAGMLDAAAALGGGSATPAPSAAPSDSPSAGPTDSPTSAPSDEPTGTPSATPGDSPSAAPTGDGTDTPSAPATSEAPGELPTPDPTKTH